MQYSSEHKVHVFYLLFAGPIIKRHQVAKQHEILSAIFFPV